MANFTIKELGNGDIEFYVEDESSGNEVRFMASWGKPKPPEMGELRLPIYMVRQVLELAHSCGKEARSAEIRKLLGGKL